MRFTVLAVAAGVLAGWCVVWLTLMYVDDPTDGLG